MSWKLKYVMIFRIGIRIGRNEDGVGAVMVIRMPGLWLMMSCLLRVRQFCKTHGDRGSFTILVPTVCFW